MDSSTIVGKDSAAGCPFAAESQSSVVTWIPFASHSRNATNPLSNQRGTGFLEASENPRASQQRRAWLTSDAGSTGTG
jgi:hypothetical protein